MHNNSQKLTTNPPAIHSHTAYCWLAALWICLLVVIALWPATARASTLFATAQLGWDIPMDRLDDPLGHLGPDAVAATETSAMTSRLSTPLNAGYLGHTVWLRFEVPARTLDSRQEGLWLLAQPTYLDFVTLYQKGVDGEWRKQISGDLVPPNQKADIRQHLFRLAPGQTALVRIQTTSAIQFQAEVLTTEALAAELARSERGMGLYFGAMAILLACIWAATAIFRTRALFSLAVLGTVNAIHIFNVRGYASLWSPDEFTLWASHAVGIGAFLLPATQAWQIKEQLTRGTRYRQTDRLLTFLIALNLLGTLSVPLGVYPAIAWVNLVSLLASDVAGVVLCLRALRQQDRIDQHALLLTAYGLRGLGGVTIAILMTGLVPLKIDATSLWQLETIALTSLLAIAVFVGMVARYQQAQLAKDRAIERLALSEQSLEERIEQRTAQLTEAQTALGQALENERTLRDEQKQFFHMISHEFRTPLAVIDSAAAEQQTFPSPDLPSQTARAAQIRRASRRLTSLVDSCLINERLDSAGFYLQTSPVKVCDLLQHAAQLVHWSPRHHLRLFVDAAPEEWVCDATLVHIALSNLVDNAVKYAAAGEIFIAARKADSGLLEVSVADEGSGMSLDVMNRIFERFERGDRTDQSRGFGLGLWVARRVARLHGGDITVESTVGEGTCFTLSLQAQDIGQG